MRTARKFLLMRRRGGTAAPSLLTDLVSYWKLDEVSGTRIDSAGTNNLTDNNTVGSATGKIGNAASFVAANSEYLSIASNASLQMGNIDFTLAMWLWIENNNSDDDGGICKTDLSGNYEYALRYNFSTPGFYVTSGGTTGTLASVQWGSAVTLNAWHFVVGWHDATANTINIQVNNGTPVSVPHSAGVHAGTAPLELGRNVLSRYHNGRIDEAGIWKRVLTAGERTLLYNSGSGLTFPFV